MKEIHNNNCYYDYCSSDFDKEFEKIGGLTWLPWVGKDYKNSKKKVLIVGESHYAKDEENKEEYLNENTATREVIHDYSISMDWGFSNPTIDNLTRAFFNNSDLTFAKNNDENLEKRKKLWKSISFYNFVQRPMLTVEERPSSEDFCRGWPIFIELIKILKPTDCVFFGTRASNYFEYMMSGLNIDHSVVSWIDVGARAYGRRFSLSLDPYSLNIMSIQHTSRYFSYPVWHNFLKANNLGLIKFLNEIIENKDENKEESPETIIEYSWVKNVPTWLTHKPIIACDYSEKDCYGDALFLSLGRAQYDNENDLSVKVLRWTGDRWSRQSEELPISRVFDCSILLLSAIKALQSEDGQIDNCYLHPQYVKEDESGFLKDILKKSKNQLVPSIKELKQLINAIDPDLL